MTLVEFEHWMALEITERYHRAFHRGLGATPLGIWERLMKAGANFPIPGDHRVRWRNQPDFYLDHVFLASGSSRRWHDLEFGALAAAPHDLLRRLGRHAHFCLSNNTECYLKVASFSRLTLPDLAAQGCNCEDCRPAILRPRQREFP
jgi:hypothetical protein